MLDSLFLNPYLIFLIGCFLLFYGSDLLINNSIVLALRLNLSKLIIVSTIVALGTSLPEIVVSIVANINDNSNIVIGNIIGSNIANISLVLGVLLLFRSIYLEKNNKLIFHVCFLMLLTFLFYFSLKSGTISIYFGLFLISLFVIYILLSIIYIDNQDFNEIDHSVSDNPILKIVFSSILIYFGSDLFIDGAIGISYNLGVSNLVVGLTIVALGTSLPELVVSINSILKKQIDISLGNIIGSNIANIVFAIGLSSIIKEIYFSYNSILIFNNFMILITLLVFLLILFFKKISKIFSLLFISIYFVFIYLNFYKVN